MAGSCPAGCGGRGTCQQNGICECKNGWTGIDCSTGTVYMVFKWKKNRIDCM